MWTQILAIGEAFSLDGIIFFPPLFPILFLSS